MAFRPCVSGCGSFLTSIDGHDRCLTCLGREHAEAAFVDGSCAHCERMSMATLRSRLSFARRLPSSSSRGSSASQKGFSAATARRLGDLQVTVAAPSEADAELSAMLLRAAELIGLEVPKVPPPDPSRAYCAAGQATTALHAMATLQVYQAKALKELHKGSPDQEVMSTLVVQERHLWLNLAQMADVDKARFLDAPVSQAGLFGDTVGDFAQQFSAVQKQTEAIRHILPQRKTSRKSPGAQPQPARRRGCPPVAPKKQEQPAPSPAEAHDVALASRRRGHRPLLRERPPRPADLRGAPDTGSPEMTEAALRGTITSAPPLPEEDRDLLCVQPLSTHG
ncbi:hypothetical protein M9458_058122, partial [Cirrhinus mrigala]